MKFSIVTVFLLLQIISPCAFGEDIKIIKFSGSAEITPAGETVSLPLTPETVILTGARLSTGPDSSIEVSAPNGRFRIEENTEVILNETSFRQSPPEGVTAMPPLELISGEVFLKLQNVAPGQTFKVKGPTGVAAIRGTAFSVRAKNRETTVMVFEHNVELASLAGPDQSVLIDTLEQSTIAPWDTAMISAEGIGFLSETILGKSTVAELKTLFIETSLFIPTAESRNPEFKAREAIYRAISLTQLSDGRTIGMLINEKPQLLAALTACVNQNITISDEPTADGNLLHIKIGQQPISQSLGVTLANTGTIFKEIPFEDYANQFGALARITTTRAAELDAKRKLTEIIYGSVISSSTRIENFVTQDDTIRTSVEGLIRGAKVVATRYYASGAVAVTVEMIGAPVREALAPVLGSKARDFLSSPAAVDPGAYLQYLTYY